MFKTISFEENEEFPGCFDKFCLTIWKILILFDSYCIWFHHCSIRNPFSSKIHCSHTPSHFSWDTWSCLRRLLSYRIWTACNWKGVQVIFAADNIVKVKAMDKETPPYLTVSNRLLFPPLSHLSPIAISAAVLQRAKLATDYIWESGALLRKRNEWDKSSSL